MYADAAGKCKQTGLEALQTGLARNIFFMVDSRKDTCPDSRARLSCGWNRGGGLGRVGRTCTLKPVFQALHRPDVIRIIDINATA